MTRNHDRLQQQESFVSPAAEPLYEMGEHGGTTAAAGNVTGDAAVEASSGSSKALAGADTTTAAGPSRTLTQVSGVLRL